MIRIIPNNTCALVLVNLFCILAAVQMLYYLVFAGYFPMPVLAGFASCILLTPEGNAPLSCQTPTAVRPALTHTLCDLHIFLKNPPSALNYCETYVNKSGVVVKCACVYQINVAACYIMC